MNDDGRSASRARCGTSHDRTTQALKLPPEAVFEAVEGVTILIATDSVRKPCTLVELRPPWTVKLPAITLDRQRLRRIRVERFHLSQKKLAQQLEIAGDALLVPNSCSKRLVQKWERGEHATLTPAYQLGLVYLLGCDVERSARRSPRLIRSTASSSSLRWRN